MDRPEKIYLDDPILLHGIEVRHTKAGLEYLIDHFNCMLTLSMLTEDNRKHYMKMIEQYKQHIELYNKPLSQ